MKIKATVCYPIYVDLEIDDEKYKEMTEDQLDFLVMDQADSIFDSSTIKPIVHEKNYEGKE